MRPRSQWPWVLLGIEIGTGVGECIDDFAPWLEIGKRICSATEILIIALLLPPFTSLDRWLRAPRIFVRLFAGLILGPGISGVIAAALYHVVRDQPLLLAFNGWATADALGVLATMPFALSLRSAQMRSLFQREALTKTLGLLILSLAGAGVIFSVSRLPLLFLLYPLLLLIDSLLAFAGSSIVVLGVVFIAAYPISHSFGPFGAWPGDLDVPRDLAVQIYLGFHLLALFPASIMFMERRRVAEELQSTNARLAVLASVDGLTGIANRRCFDERFSQEWARALRHRTPLALAMIDLDNFKQFNDLYGHLAGDRCLRAVAEELAREVKRSEDLAARVGGEEFALLLPHTTAQQAGELVKRIRRSVSALGIDHIGNAHQHVTISVGYSALIPTARDGQSELIQLADGALYRAKSGGRNRVETLCASQGLEVAGRQFSTTSKNRIIRMLGGDH